MFILHLGEIAFVHTTTTYTGNNSKYVVNKWASQSKPQVKKLLSKVYHEWAWGEES